MIKLDMLKDKVLVLASKSPRRKELLASLDFKVVIKPIDVVEDSPSFLSAAETALYLAALKAQACPPPKPNEIWITSDTVVSINNQVLGKPKDKREALIMLRQLSDARHEVITAVCLQSDSLKKTFYETTKVTFRKLSSDEMHYYIDRYQPFDKAGSYGIQEWIGKIAIQKIKGCYYNVMGLPLSRLYLELEQFNDEV